MRKIGNGDKRGKTRTWGISSVGRVVTIVTIEDKVFKIQKYNELA